MMVQRLQTAVLIAGLSYLTGCLGPQSEEPTLRNSRQVVDRNQGNNNNTGGGNNNGGGNQQLNFQQANAILKDACGGTNCHGADAANLEKYVDSQDNLTARKDQVLKRINDGTMPIGGKTFKSDADKKNLVAYMQNLGQGGGGNGGGNNGGGAAAAIALMAKGCGKSAGCHQNKYDNEQGIKAGAASLKANTQRMLDSAAYSKNDYNDDEKKAIMDYVNSL